MNKNYIINEIEKELGKDVSINFTRVPKNNVMMSGISIRKNGSNIAANIYYMESWDDDKIVAETLKTYKTNANPTFDVDDITENITKWDYASSRVVPALYNTTKSVFDNDLVTMPYLNDIGILFKIIVDSGKESNASIKVTDKLLKAWGVTTKTLLDVSKRNLDDTVVIRSMEDTMSELNGGESINERHVDNITTMSCASNVSKIDGAAVMLILPKLVKRGEIDDVNYYIIPSSIHEILMINSVNMGDEIDPSVLVNMITNVNSTILAPQEYLSDNAYMYDSKSSEVVVLE